MKRTMLVALLLALFPYLAFADGYYSRNVTSATNIKGRKGVVYAVKALSNGTNACTCTLYNSATTGTTDKKNYAAVVAGINSPDGDMIPTIFDLGIYAVPSGTGCECQVWYK